MENQVRINNLNTEMSEIQLQRNIQEKKHSEQHQQVQERVNVVDKQIGRTRKFVTLLWKKVQRQDRKVEIQVIIGKIEYLLILSRILKTLIHCLS